jgi:hypothetical protein
VHWKELSSPVVEAKRGFARVSGLTSLVLAEGGWRRRIGTSLDGAVDGAGGAGLDGGAVGFVAAGLHERLASGPTVPAKFGTKSLEKDPARPRGSTHRRGKFWKVSAGFRPRDQESVCHGFGIQSSNFYLQFISRRRAAEYYQAGGNFLR